jgi:hypothetical protein
MLPRLALTSTYRHTPGFKVQVVMNMRGFLWLSLRAELLQKVQQIQRVVHEEPTYVKPRGKVRETSAAIVRDPNLEACTVILQDLENDHEFLYAPS